MKTRIAVVIGALVGALLGFLLGRGGAPVALLSVAHADGARVAAYSGGVFVVDDVRDAIAGLSDARQRRAAVEQLVRARLLAQRAEGAKRHLTPDFLRRYSEELARLEIEKSFEEPFQKQLPTEDELRKFFDENKDRLGRPERVRLAHVALFAPASDADARARKRKQAEQGLASVRHAKDAYAFGRLAITVSDDPRSRAAAGELPFLTRDEVVSRLSAEVAEIAFTAAPGTIVDRVIETEAGFQLVKVIAREEGREARYDELHDAIEARLTAERREKAFKAFMDGVWASGDVKIDEAALEQVGRESTQGAGPKRPSSGGK